MIEITIHPRRGHGLDAGLWFTLWISTLNAKLGITDAVLRENLSRRAADDLYDYMMAYLDSPEGREMVWSLDNSTGAAQPTAQNP